MGVIVNVVSGIVAFKAVGLNVALPGAAVNILTLSVDVPSVTGTDIVAPDNVTFKLEIVDIVPVVNANSPGTTVSTGPGNKLTLDIEFPNAINDAVDNVPSNITVRIVCTVPFAYGINVELVPWNPCVPCIPWNPCVPCIP